VASLDTSDLDDDPVLKEELERRNRQRTSDGLPSRAGELAGPFRKACEELRDSARKSAVKSLEVWLDGRHRDGRHIISLVDGVFDGHHSDEPKGYRKHVADLVSGRGLLSVINKAAETNAGTGTGPTGSADRFPLRESMLLPWARSAGSDRRSRHLTRVLRIRSALVSTATEVVLEDLDACVSALHDRMRARAELYQGLIRDCTEELAGLSGLADAATGPWAAAAGILDSIEPPDLVRAQR
jgi:hypothetical protein